MITDGWVLACDLHDRGLKGALSMVILRWIEAVHGSIEFLFVGQVTSI